MDLSPEGATNCKEEIGEAGGRNPPNSWLGSSWLSCSQGGADNGAIRDVGTAPFQYPFSSGKLSAPFSAWEVRVLVGHVDRCPPVSVSFDPALCGGRPGTISEAVSPVSLAQVVTSKPRSSRLCTCANSWVAPDHGMANKRPRFERAQVMLWVKVHRDE